MDDGWGNPNEYFNHGNCGICDEEVQMMGRQIRLVLMLLAFVVILFSTVLVLETTKSEEQIKKVVFRSSPPTDVHSVHIQNDFGDIYVDFLDGGYVLGEVPIDVVDMELFVDMMTDVADVYALTEIKSPQNLEIYGLNNKTAVVKVTYMDSNEMTLNIGNYEPISKGYYCSISDYDGVYLIAEDRVNGFIQPEKYFISKYVTPPKPAQSQSSLGHVKGMTLEGGALLEKVILSPVEAENEQIMIDVISFGSATHLIEINGMKYRVDQRYAALVFDSVIGLKAKDIIDYNLSEEAMETFGFENPDMHVVFDFKRTPNDGIIQYDIKVLEKNGSFYASCNNRGIIYQLNPPYFYSVTVEKFPVRWFFSPLLFELKALEIKRADEFYLFELSGTTNNDLAVTCNGESFDLNRFRRFYKLITSGAHDNTMSEQIEVSEPSLMEITYSYRNVNKQEDVLKLYAGESRRHYAKVNGMTRFTIKELFHTRVSQALDLLFTDEVFEIDW
ncbi:MAG: hypothetical protein CVU95_10440 [Firmicutes bacterium HGW-Firmicutes-2]|jgi:hypothetical protein|nr:MAG: hypothetical protein CVU95_10440 [Firmicutes bacterium HGW-Firmicutes-2]